MGRKTMKTGRSSATGVGWWQPRWWAVLAVTTIVLAVLMTHSDQALAQGSPPPETIAGQVVQLTSGADMPEDLVVTLTVRDTDGNFVKELQAQVQPDGTFDFADLQTNESEIYRLYLEYGGIGRTVALEEVERPDDVRLEIWETTDSLDAISVALQSTVIEKFEDEDGIFGVLELIVLRNGSDRVFKVDNDAAIERLPRFGLPRHHGELEIESDLPTGPILEASEGFALANAIPPGEYQLLIRYLVYYEGDEFDFSRPMPLGADQVRFLIPPDIGTVSGDNLVASGRSAFGGQNYNVLTGSSYSRDSHMTITIEGLPHRSWLNSFTRSGWMTLGLPVFAGSAMVVLLIYAIFISRKRRSRSNIDARDTRRALVARIARIDELHETGGMSDAEHDQRRQQLMERATGLASDA